MNQLHPVQSKSISRSGLMQTNILLILVLILLTNIFDLIFLIMSMLVMDNTLLTTTTTTTTATKDLWNTDSGGELLIRANEVNACPESVQK